MPRPASTTGVDGLPLWDTFEAFFFLFTGLSIGLVLGLLFPSLWRTLRRRFRNTRKFGSLKIDLPLQVESPVQTLEHIQEEEESDDDINISAQFIFARSLIHERKERDAINTYLSILGNERVSKQQTNRALFELSQTYDRLGLQSRAYETAFELLHRKPKQTQVFEYLLQLCSRYQMQDRIPSIVDTHKGNSSEALKLRVASLVAGCGEEQLKKNEIAKAITFGRESLKHSIGCARGQILIWEATSLQLWEQLEEDEKGIWSAFVADLEGRMQIAHETKISAAAGAEHLARLMEKISTTSISEALSQLKNGFMFFGNQNLDKNLLESLDKIVFYASLNLLENQGDLPAPNQLFLDLLERLSPTSRSLWECHGSAAQAVVLGYKTHSCLSCLNVAPRFSWSCTHCQNVETLVPVLNPTKN